MTDSKNETRSRYAEEVDREIERCIDRMESKDYTFPPRMTRKDYWFIGIFIVICLAAIIVGAWL